MIRIPKILPAVLGGGCGILVVVVPGGRLSCERHHRGSMVVITQREKCSKVV